MPDALIYMFGTLTGVGLVLLILVCMRKAAEQAKLEQRREHARIQAEKDAAYDRGYNRAIRDYKRRESRSAAEEFVDTFENRRAKFALREVRQ